MNHNLVLEDLAADRDAVDVLDVLRRVGQGEVAWEKRSIGYRVRGPAAALDRLREAGLKVAMKPLCD